MPDKIKLFTTGGTIDCESIKSTTKEYFFSESYIPKMLEQARNKSHTEVEHLMSKDSLLMTESDREIILQKCLSCDENKIVITHGTDTITESAKYLGEKIKDKTIVFVGAMIPYNQDFSDAMFNLGTAMGSVHLLPKGVFISMNGKVFNYNNVRKNKDSGIFEVML